MASTEGLINRQGDRSRSGRLPEYVLITPARNEGAFITETIESVARQTHKPVVWMIVSDGSTDGTDEIVRAYAKAHSWIRFRRQPERAERNFAGKVLAFNRGYEEVKRLAFDLIGSLDADISFDRHHFEFLAGRFADDPDLGVAGGPFIEGGWQYDYQFSSREHVSGACQLFRRECFEDIGGYVPLVGGGIDLVAVTTARMKGWKTRTFEEVPCSHHRAMGTAARGRLLAAFRLGRKDYAMGNHPVWQFARCCYQLSRPPLGLGGALLFCGYTWDLLTRQERVVSQAVINFRRAEQMRRLANLVLPSRQRS